MEPQVKQENGETEDVKRGFFQGNRGRGGGRGGRGRGGRGGYGGREGPRSADDRLIDRLNAMQGPTVDLPPREEKEKKFTNRCRLFVGNLTNDVTDEDFKKMFEPFGESAEHYLNLEKAFGFVKMDFRANAEKAKQELDGMVRNGRPLKVRFASLGTALKVKNLSPWVSNELLDRAFSIFGELERAIVITDDRGKSTSEGIIEFARKPGALMAVKKCSEGCFFLTSSPRPVIVEPLETMDEEDGAQEKNFPKKNAEYQKERAVGPRFATPGSFEYEYGTRWKSLYELDKEKRRAVEREMEQEKSKLEDQMEFAKYEHETEMLREQLRQREQDNDRQKHDWEMRQRQREEMRRNDEDMMLRRQEEVTMRIRQQEEDMRRRQQENRLFMQANELNSLLDQQERAMWETRGSGMDRGMQDSYMGAGTSSTGIPPDPKTFMEGYQNSRPSRFDQADVADNMMGGPRGGGGSRMGGAGSGMGGGRGAGSPGAGMGGSNWAHEEQAGYDVPNKRRRF